MRVLQVPAERRSRLSVQVIREVEKRGEVKLKLRDDQLEIDSEDPGKEWVAEQVATALLRGFPATRAYKLFSDEYYMETLDLGQMLHRREKAITRYKGRIIGTEGAVKKKLEELSDTGIAVDEDQVHLLGQFEDLRLAKEAITRLLEGQNHNAVFAFLERALKKRKMLI